MESGENSTVDLEDLREDVNEFSANLKHYSDAVEVSSTTILQIIARIRERANVQHIEIQGGEPNRVIQEHWSHLSALGFLV